VLEEEDDNVKKTNLKPSLAEEAAAAAKSAAAAAVDVARASQELLNSKNEGGIMIEFLSFPPLALKKTGFLKTLSD
jgi:peroxin-14